jgi:hypothetical protein
LIQRESNLILSLKRKLDEIDKLFLAAKQRQRCCWELILQGNTQKLDINFILEYDSVEKCQTQIPHILNDIQIIDMFVRYYVRFYRDITGDIEEFQTLSEKSQTLQKGGTINNDITRELVLRTFPKLPKMHPSHQSSISISSLEVEDSFLSDIINNEEIERDLGRHF